MSYHAIEDLVEDTVESVIQSSMTKASKKNLIADLYFFQSHFDTKNTVFRLKEELKDVGYLIPVDIKDIEKAAKQKINLKELKDPYEWYLVGSYFVAYEKSKSGKIYFYYEYGSSVWEVLNKKNHKNKSMAELLCTIVAAMDKNSKTELLYEWYLAILTTLIEGGLSAAQSFNIKDPLDIIKNKSVLKLRNLFSSLQEYKGKPRYFKKQNSKKVLQELLDQPTEAFLAKLFLNLDVSIKQFENDLKNQLEEQKKSLKKKEKKYLTITSLAEDILKKELNVELIKELKTGINKNIAIGWLFKFPKKSNNTNYLCVELDDEYAKGLQAYLVTHCELLESWQTEKNLNLNPRIMHFKTNVGAMIMGAKINVNTQKEWAINEKSSEANVKKVIFNLAKNIKKVSQPYEKFYSKNMEDILDSFDIQKILNKEDRMDLRIKYGFFNNDIEVTFAYASLKWEKTKKQPTEEIAILKDQAWRVHPIYPLRTTWVEGIKKLQDGPFFPETSEILSYRELDDDEAKSLNQKL